MNPNITTYSDAQLFDMLKKGGQEKNSAFTEIYRRYNQRLYAYILKVTGSSDETKDIFQEMFVKFVQSAEKEKNSATQLMNCGGYLMIIARNLCLNHKRSKKHNVELEEYHSITTSSPRYEQEELLNLIHTALEYLDFDYREAFVLRLYHDLSYEEIADITQTTIPTIKNRVWRAKEKIRKILAPVLSDFDTL